jgi:hypothetical protein
VDLVTFLNLSKLSFNHERERIFGTCLVEVSDLCRPASYHSFSVSQSCLTVTPVTVQPRWLRLLAAYPPLRGQLSGGVGCC